MARGTPEPVVIEIDDEQDPPAKKSRVFGPMKDPRIVDLGFVLCYLAVQRRIAPRVGVRGQSYWVRDTPPIQKLSSVIASIHSYLSSPPETRTVPLYGFQLETDTDSLQIIVTRKGVTGNLWSKGLTIAKGLNPVELDFDSVSSTYGPSPVPGYEWCFRVSFRKGDAEQALFIETNEQTAKTNVILPWGPIVRRTREVTYLSENYIW